MRLGGARGAGLVAAGLVAAALAGCAQNAARMASPSPDQPWAPTGSEDGAWSLQRKVAATGSDPASFAIPADPRRAAMAAAPDVSATRVHDLPALIDLAQRSNPATRVAWEQARQAALAVGIAESTWLPTISASVVGGRQRLTQPLPAPIGDRTSFTTTVSGSTQVLALQWLLFDFGQRRALTDAAKHEAFAANVLFNGAHQRLILQVASAYYAYGASVEGRDIARIAQGNAAEILKAAEARLASGVGTTVEVAQARQLVAQARLRLTAAEGQQRDAYQALIAAVGVNAPLKVDAAAAARRPLPAPASADVDRMVRMALSQRADVAASYAQIAAARSAAAAADADYLPKVFVGATMSHAHGGLALDGLPTIGQQGQGSGVLVGVTMPIYDSGARLARQRVAQSRINTATANFELMQSATVAEVVGARNRLQSALESWQAASALVEAARVSRDATLASYRAGTGTLTELAATDNGLLDARMAKADAHAAAMTGALELAFVTGALTSRAQADGK